MLFSKSITKLTANALLKQNLPQKQSKRYAGGFFKKNIRFEENAGLREAQYRTFEFNTSNVLEIFGFLILPAVIVYYGIIEEYVRITFYFFIC